MEEWELSWMVGLPQSFSKVSLLRQLFVLQAGYYRILNDPSYRQRQRPLVLRLVGSSDRIYSLLWNENTQTPAQFGQWPENRSIARPPPRSDPACTSLGSRKTPIEDPQFSDIDSLAMSKFRGIHNSCRIVPRRRGLRARAVAMMRMAPRESPVECCPCQLTNPHRSRNAGSGGNSSPIECGDWLISHRRLVHDCISAKPEYSRDS
jgi:hypothetical protein